MASVARLVILRGARQGEEYSLLRGSFFIGRSGNNNLVLDDRSVSRRHVVINYLDGQFVLSDLQSFSGTLVNGHRIEEVTLAHGDVIRMGEAQCRFLLGAGSKRHKSIRRRHRARVGHESARAHPQWWGVGLLTVVAIGALGFASWRLAGWWPHGSPTISAAVHEEVVHSYQEGIRQLNEIKDAERARQAWEMVLQLDPYMVTPEARKAKGLLQQLPSAGGNFREGKGR